MQYILQLCAVVNIWFIFPGSQSPDPYIYSLIMSEEFSERKNKLQYF